MNRLFFTQFLNHIIKVKFSIHITCVIVLISGFSFNSMATTVHPASSSLTDVQKAIDNAAIGDEVLLPDIPSTWNDRVKINKPIILKGAGPGKTVISNGGVVLATTLGQSYRITGIDFNPMDPSMVCIIISGDGKTWRIDHCNFYCSGSNTNTGILINAGDAYGVVDHCVFRNSRCNVYGASKGVPSWKTTSPIGTGDAFYIEDNNFYFNVASMNCIDASHGGRFVFRYNTVINSYCEAHSLVSSEVEFTAFQVQDTVKATVDAFNKTQVGATIYWYEGKSKIINYINNRTVVVSDRNVRGTIDSAMGASISLDAIGRASRSYEIYNNVFVSNSPGSNINIWAVSLRAGTGVVWGNSVKDIAGGKYAIFGRVDYYRSFMSRNYLLQLCDGTNEIDGNTPGMSGYPCLDQIGRGQDNGLASTDRIPQQFEPLYNWDNLLYGVSDSIRISIDQYVDTNLVGVHIKPGRDIIYGKRPGYTPFQYPHPIAMAGFDNSPFLKPRNIRISTSNYK